MPADAFSITWEASADGAGAKDRIKVTQLVAAAVPVRVLQATIAQLDGAFALPVAVPADALPETGVKRGGLNVAVQPKLTGALPGHAPLLRDLSVHLPGAEDVEVGRPQGRRALGRGRQLRCRPTSTATAWRTTSRRAPAIRRTAAIASPPT